MDRKGSDITLKIGVRIHWKISRWKLAYLPHSIFNFFFFSNSKCYSWSKTCSKLHDAWHLRAHENVELKCNKNILACAFMKYFGWTVDDYFTLQEHPWVTAAYFGRGTAYVQKGLQVSSLLKYLVFTCALP